MMSARIINRFMHELSLKLGIDISKITQFEFRVSPTPTRRLLSVTVSLSVISTSKNEANKVESVVDITLVNQILAVSSDNSIIASSLQIQTAKISPVVDADIPDNNKKSDKSGGKQKTLFMWIAIASTLFVCAVVILVCIVKYCNPPHQRLIPGDADVTKSDYYYESYGVHHLYHTCGK